MNPVQIKIKPLFLWPLMKVYPLLMTVHQCLIRQASTMVSLMTGFSLTLDCSTRKLYS